MIKFGTDGWRAIIADEFTFDNVRKVARAIALYLLHQGLSSKPVIIGYDARFLADKFAEEVAKVLKAAGMNGLLTERDTPTPVVAWEVRERKAAGAVMLTASHNPAGYCGIKFIPEYAGPADERITAELQKSANEEFELLNSGHLGSIERFDPQDAYIKSLGKFIDVSLIREANLKIVYDPLHGSGRGYVDRILEQYGCVVEVLHGGRDVLFEGKSPEPTEENLKELKAKVFSLTADVGLSNDGDADRFGVVDERQGFLSANQLLPLLFKYLVEEKGFSGSAVRSVATSHFIDRIARKKNIKLHETPVGFKYIAEIMLKEPVIIGGEESGGLSIKGHIPEKDGILANLLLVETLAHYKKSLSAIWQQLIDEFGAVYNERVNLELEPGTKEAFMRKLDKETPVDIAGVKVASVSRLDGVKLLLEDGSWVLARPSGTEPIVRLYAEADNREKLAAMLSALQDLL